MNDFDAERTGDAHADKQPAQHVEEILRAIAGIAYGSVEIVIHDSKVVQIECREKIRLTGGQTRKNPIRRIR